MAPDCIDLNPTVELLPGPSPIVAQSDTTLPHTPQQPKLKPGLKKIPPYWYVYSTRAKGRWFDREILELVSTEFRDRSVEYYVSGRSLCVERLG